MKTTRPQPRLTIFGVPCEADAGEHICLEEAQPVLVRNFKEGLGFEDTGIVDEDIGIGSAADDGVRALRGTKVSGCGDELCAGHVAFEFRDRGVHARLRATVDRDHGAQGCELACCGITNAAGRTGDDGASSLQIQVRALTLNSATLLKPNKAAKANAPQRHNIA